MAAGVFQIVGIYESGSNDLDRLMAQIPFATAQETFTLYNQAHALVIQSDNLERSDQLAKQLENSVQPLGDYTALTWEGLNPGLKESIELDMVSGWLFLFSLILIVAFGVLNTFLMSLLERTREFGLLVSLGMTPWSLMRMVSIELVALIIVGVLPGLALGSLIILYFSVYGFSIPGAEEINKLWNLPATLYPQMNLEHLLAGPLVVALTTLLLVLPFSLRLRNLEPVEALRSV